MKKILYILIVASSTLLSSCSGWLDVLPKNEQVTGKYWKSKEDVEAMVASGYYYMRNANTSLISWGELRGASVYTPISSSQGALLQNFQLNQSQTLCQWDVIYQTINMANSVIKYAPGVQAIDETYSEGAMKSHQSEAYFMRALMYFYLVRNFRDVPLVLEPYINDSAPYAIAKSSEQEIIAQIKADINTALASGASKEYYESDKWNGASKGRATKWALYALMADVCLWSEDYEGTITFADYLINATSAKRPVFMSIPEQWFTIFNPGNSNESIFELNWDYTTFQQTQNNPASSFTLAAPSGYLYTPAMAQRLIDENNILSRLPGKESVRGSFGSYVRKADGFFYIWKYIGTDIKNDENALRAKTDANFIIYRMADVMLMKAEALIRKGEGEWPEAIEIINKIRLRANLNNINVSFSEVNEQNMLEYVLNERDMEFAAEGKRWYDLLRFGKSQNFKYKQQFIEMIVENNSSTNDPWLRSVLKNNDAWYLPINQDEIEDNELLIQNPYYAITN